MPEIFDPYYNAAATEQLLHPPNPTIYEPKGDDRPVKTIGQPCAVCGKPVSKWSQRPGAVCRSCYGAKAVQRHTERVTDKYRRLDAHVNRYSWLVYVTSQAWATFSGLSAASEHDFSTALLDAIDQRERELGVPFVKWPPEEYGELMNQAFA